MAASEAKTFVAVANNCWGKGKTIDEAKKNARLEGGRKGEKCWVVAVAAEWDEVKVEGVIDCNVYWPKDSAVVKWPDKL